MTNLHSSYFVQSLTRRLQRIPRNKYERAAETRLTATWRFLCKFNGNQCLKFVPDKNIRRFKEVAAVTGWTGPETFVEYKTSLPDNALSAWDVTVAVKYTEAAAI